MDLKPVQTGDELLLYALYKKMFTDAPAAFGKTLPEAERAAKDESAYTDWLATSPDAIGLLAYDQGRLCGFSMGCVGKLINGNLNDSYGDTVTFGRMWVDPAHRRRGIALALLEEVEDWTRQKEIYRLELWVTETNVEAINLYRKVGFEMTETFERMHSLGDLKLCLMVKPLSSKP